MLAKDFMQAAWQKMSGNWGVYALINLIILVISSVCDSLTYGILFIILTGPFTLSIAYCSLTVSNNQDIKVEDAFIGFQDFVRSFLAYIINSIFIFLWSLLLIIPGIIKTLSYSMTFFILQEDKNISANDARKLSMEMMNGYKWKLFCLYFSFIGWILLSILTFGILFLWISSYMDVAKAEFYKNIKAEKGITVGNSTPSEEAQPTEEKE